MKITSEIIEEHFAPKLRLAGFVSKNKGYDWYAVLKGKFFCSIHIIDEPNNDVLFRVQPLCATLLNRIQKNWYGRSDIYNRGEIASRIRKANGNEDKAYDINGTTPLDVIIEFYNTLLFKVVIPYLESIVNFTDIKISTDWQLPAICAYLDGNAEAFYNSNATIQSLTNFIYEETFTPEDNEFFVSIRTAVLSNDMSVIGKYLQKREKDNIEYLTAKIPKLFKNNQNIKPLITDEFIANTALNEIRDASKIKYTKLDLMPFDFVPFPTTAPIYEFDEQLAYDVARNMIAEEFSAILLDNGFVSTDDGFKWHKLKDNMVYYINFAWNKGASISILYNCCTVFDDVKGMHDERAIYALALFDLLKMVGAAIPHEYYPNAFLNGNDVLEWQKNRLSLQLTQIVLPAFNGEIVTDSFDLKKKFPPYLNLICEKTVDKQTTAELAAKYGRIRVTNGVSRQFEDERVLKTNNNDYINLYFSKCKDFNLRYLKDNIFGF